MENNSKSGLKMKQVIGTTLAVIILSTNLQLFVSTKEKTQVAQEEAGQNEVEVAATYEREMLVTSRSSQERTLKEEIQEEVEEQYISIEEISISKNMDITKQCGISKEDFNKLMKDLKVDTSGFFARNSDIIYDLCEKYQLNEIFFCGLIAGESGWNISSNHRKKCNYISMMSKGKLIQYASEKQGLEAAAKLLHTKYLTPGAPYYRGKTLAGVQKKFCPNSSTWVGLIYGCMKQVIK